jgi:hypothetical protein
MPHTFSTIHFPKTASIPTLGHYANRRTTSSVEAISSKTPPSTPIIANAALCKAG